ncbi:serine/threonine-protein kinase HAL4/sat4 [Irineochytrium annulatum]|nr:serine/threonine-protein kinase HAL4/sat4 [Irineochytrium annulatum]
MAFSMVRKRELILGLSDNSLHCYNIDTGQLVAKLPAYHRAEPMTISVHPSMPYAMTTSRVESILWDTEKWERKRILQSGGPPGVQQSSFTPSGDSIITAFNDGTILIWDTESFDVRWKIVLERFSADLAEDQTEVLRLMTMPRTSFFSVSKDGELLIYGGLAPSLYVWSLIEKRLLHEILLPSFQGRVISQVEFVGHTSKRVVDDTTEDPEKIYGWTVIQVLLSEILSKDDWLKVWDHLITNPPAFMYYIVVAYIRKFKSSLMAITKVNDFKYPIFNQYPEFIVNYQSKMKERIRADEEDYLRKRHVLSSSRIWKVADEVSRLTEELRRDKANWENADWKMNDMVEKWWEQMMSMEESNIDRKARLDALEKEQRAKALRQISEARKSFVNHQNDTTRMHAHALARAVGVNALEMEARVDEDTIDSRFKEVEMEWLARREEMLSAREELARLDKRRLERLVKNARKLGVTNLDREETPPVSPRRRPASPDRRNRSASPLNPRVWSPEMLEETRHRRGEGEETPDVRREKEGLSGGLGQSLATPAWKFPPSITKTSHLSLPLYSTCGRPGYPRLKALLRKGLSKKESLREVDQLRIASAPETCRRRLRRLLSLRLNSESGGSLRLGSIHRTCIASVSHRSRVTPPPISLLKPLDPPQLRPSPHLFLHPSIPAAAAMQTFSTDVWAPGLDSTTSAAVGRNNLSLKPSRRPSAASSVTNRSPQSRGDLTPTSAGVNGVASSASLQADGTAAAANGKKHGILYRIFHHNDHESSIIGRSRRSYHSGSESEFDSEEEYASDASEVGNAAGGEAPALFPVTGKGRGNSSGDDGRGATNGLRRSVSARNHPEGDDNRGSGVMRMSMSGRKDDSGADSESETEAQGSTRYSIGRKSGAGNVFKDLLMTGSRKKSTTAGSSPNASPSGSDGNLSAASFDSESESDAATQAHTNNIFRNIMTGRKHASSATHIKPPPLNAHSASSAALSHSQPSTPVKQNLDSATHAKPPLPLPDKVSSSLTPQNVDLPRSASETSLAEKYGKKEEILGRGANAVVRLCCPLNSNKKFAIKEFRKRRKDETQKEYVKKLIAEFCISSTLDHPNVVKTVDLIQDEKRQWCVVMEFCAGGDLYARIHSGTLTDPDEINCFFVQLVLENLLLDGTGRILKITDFGVSEVFRTPFGKLSKKAHGVCGSGPYIAPEEFESKEYDSELVDVWAIGII